MAFEVEQRLIYECRHNPLLINKNYKVRNLIQLDPKPVKPSKPYKNYLQCKDQENGPLLFQRALKNKKTAKEARRETKTEESY